MAKGKLNVETHSPGLKSCRCGPDDVLQRLQILIRHLDLAGLSVFLGSRKKVIYPEKEELKFSKRNIPE